jgi:predicted MFS family arabinose efflux permease
MSEVTPNTRPARLAPILVALTLARLTLNSARRFPYVILTPMAASLGVPRATLETALSLEWATGALSPFAGRYIDRLGRKRIMLVGLGSLAFFAGIAALGQTVGVVLFALVASGVSKILFDPSMQAYIGDRVAYHLRGMAIGITELAWSGSLFISGPLAAFLIERANTGAIFAVLCAGSVLAFFLLVTLLPDDHSSQPRDELQTQSAWRLLRASRSALAILAAGALMSMAAESINIVYEAWMRGAFVLSTVAFGALSWVIGAAEISGEGFVIAASDRIGKRRLAVFGLVATGLASFILPLTGGSLPASIAGLFLMFLCFETSIIALIPMATEALPTARGLMMGSNMAALAGGRAIGALLGGLLFRGGGFALNGTVALILNLVGAALIWRFAHEYGSHGHSASASE